MFARTEKLKIELQKIAFAIIVKCFRSSLSDEDVNNKISCYERNQVQVSGYHNIVTNALQTTTHICLHNV